MEAIDSKSCLDFRENLSAVIVSRYRALGSDFRFDLEDKGAHIKIYTYTYTYTWCERIHER